MTREHFYRFCYVIVRPLVGIYYPVKIYGRENIPDGGALICANHSSNVDPVFLGFALGPKRMVTPMAKESLLKIPLIGRILGKLGAFPVRRGASDVSAVKFALKQLKAGEYVVMFPEGTRVKSREEGEPKTGAAMLACRTGVPVVPIYLPIKKRVLRWNRIYVGEPMYMKSGERHPSQQDYEEMTRELMDRIYGCGDGV